MPKLVPDYAQQIDAKTRELMLEFFDHVREVQKLPPEKHDPRKILKDKGARMIRNQLRQKWCPG